MRRVLVSVGVVLALLAGYAVADAEDVVPGVLTLTPARPAAPAGTAAAAGDPSTSGWPPTTPAAAVLGAPNPDAPLPSPAVLSGRLTTVLGRLGAGGAGQVVDVATGRVLFSRGAASPRTPASTTKLLTAVSVLTGLGPAARLTTKVVSALPGQIVLVGGGDIRLSSGVGSSTAVYGHAGLDTLAAQTATALKAAGTQRVSLGFDDSLFSGPSLSPHWVPSDSASGMVGPVTALGLNAKAAVDGVRAPADPSLVTAVAFAGDLTRLGISVTGIPHRVRAAAGASVLGSVQSASIGELLDYTLTVSDNTEAEVLARLGAVAAGRPGSFTGAAEQNVAAAAALHVPVTGVRLYDGSGLARADLIPPQTLTWLVATAAGTAHPALRSLFAGLPIAGLTGTLTPRFADPTTRVGAGIVRAKTGTLAGVNTLAGTTLDADGRLLAFAFMASHPTATSAPGRQQVDRAAAVVTACGCA
jgi:D-alanyl-D-alanine carboxypeptidase/D-alanyl-D-alanine-endopeptidase (penicillin-binding protein 4)